MTEIVERGGQDLASLTVDELRDELVALLGTTVDALRRMAMIVAELERRGEDLRSLRLGLIHYLRLIASGQILPDVVARFAGQPMLLSRISRLPISDQQRLARGETLRLPVMRGDQIDWRQVDPMMMTAEQMHIAFAQTHIRSEAEMISRLEAVPQREKRKPPQRHARAEKERGGIVVGRSFAPLGDVLAALSDLGGTSAAAEIDDETKPLVIPLTAAEHQALKIRAAQSNMTMAALARRAMAAGGLIGGAGDAE